MSSKTTKSSQKASANSFHEELLQWALREYVMDTSKHKHYDNNRKKPIKFPKLFQDVTNYMHTHFSQLKEFKSQHYSEDSVRGTYGRWFKNASKRTSNRRKLNKFRLSCKDKVKDLLVSNDSKDLPIKTKELLGPWWSRLQGRVLSPYMHKDALNNKGKHKKRKRSPSETKVCTSNE